MWVGEAERECTTNSRTTCGARDVMFSFPHPGNRPFVGCDRYHAAGLQRPSFPSPAGISSPGWYHWWEWTGTFAIIAASGESDNRVECCCCTGTAGSDRVSPWYHETYTHSTLGIPPPSTGPGPPPLRFVCFVIFCVCHSSTRDAMQPAPSVAFISWARPPPTRGASEESLSSHGGACDHPITHTPPNTEHFCTSHLVLSMAV